jgi:glycerol-3-phosphate acyltransferase PlsX
MIPGVDRPALAVTVPTRTGSAILLDAGANLECRAEHLVQFAHMGSAFARAERRLERPAVGLLSIGEEAVKGTDLIREAHAALAATSLNFIGNLEARDLFSGRADVVVCDGFTGNIALKVGEGLVETVEHLLRQELAAAPIARFGAWLGREAFRRFKRRVDYTEFGGAPLLGVAGLAVVGHGRSPARAIRHGIVMAERLASAGLTEAIRQRI